MLKFEIIAIDRIYVPVKRRKTLNPEVVKQIAESILELGEQTPPVAVRRDEDRFVLVEGLHRLEACKALGEESIRCVLVSTELAAHKPLLQSELMADPEHVKMEHLRRLRLQKEAREKAVASSLEAAPRSEPKSTGANKMKSGSAKQSATLADWLKDRQRHGSRY